MTGGWSTPHRDQMVVGETFVQGKDQATARMLLAAADDLGLDRSTSVRTTNHGFIVPDAVWERAQENQRQADGQDF